MHFLVFLPSIFASADNCGFGSSSCLLVLCVCMTCVDIAAVQQVSFSNKSTSRSFLFVLFLSAA